MIDCAQVYIGGYMTNKLTLSLLSIAVISANANVFADHSHVEEVTVEGFDRSTQQQELSASLPFVNDTAAALKTMPGAEVNSNGAITGIAQYRGLYGGGAQ